MEAITVHSDVKNGMLETPISLHIKRMLSANFEGKRVTVRIERFIKRRSSNQNRFMHGPFFRAMKAAHAEAGEALSSDEVKELFKKAFGLVKVIRAIDGQDVEILKSTKDYSTTECEAAMEKARAFYAQFDQHLPFPHEDNRYA